MRLTTWTWSRPDGVQMKAIRKALVSCASLGLWVPSVVEPQERNLLINPAHPQYTSITVVTETLNFEFDPRLF